MNNKRERGGKYKIFSKALLNKTMFEVYINMTLFNY